MESSQTAGLTVWDEVGGDSLNQRQYLSYGEGTPWEGGVRGNIVG